MRLLLALTIIMLAATSEAYGQTPSTCPPLYNGGIVCQQAKDFSVDKKVQTPKDGSFVDFLPENETKVAPNRTMIFRIEVTNKTAKTLRNITVTDTLPGFVRFVRSDTSVQQSGEKITYAIASLETKKSTTVNIETKIVAQENLLQGSGPICVANQVEAKSGFSNLARDFVTFCIDRGIPSPTADTTAPSFPSGQTKGGQEAPTPLPTQTNITKGGQALPTTTPVPTQTTTTKGGQQVYPVSNINKNPNTGPETLALIGLLPAAVTGLWFRRKSRIH